MSRGFLSGAAWGTVVAGFGLVVASQMASMSGPEMDQNRADTPMAEQTAAAGALADTEAQPPASQKASDTAEAAPEPMDVATDDTVAQPPIETADTSADTNADTTTESIEDTEVAAPAQPQDAVPDLADTETEVAQAPILPESSASPVTGTAPDGLGSDTTVAEPASDSQIAMIPEAQVAAPEAMAPTGAAPAPDVSAAVDAPPAIADGRVADLPDSALADTPPADPDLPPPAPQETVIIVDDVVVPEAPGGGEGAGIETAQRPEPAAQDTADQMVTATPARPAPGFGGKVEGVRTGRLPSIGGTTTDTTPDPAAEGADVAQGNADAAGLVVNDANLPAIERFARAFENADNKPLFAILLQDTGGPDIDREALAKIPFPVSFVIDPTAPDAALAAKIYRDAGQEVLMLATGIPAGATAADLSVSFEATAAVLPEAVGLVDLTSGGFQGNRTLAAQVLMLVADQGRGVVTWDRGLNAASQIARREGMRSALIFRALDAEGEQAPVIRRYLDRAAFKAAQDGRVVVAGQTRPETIAALLEWAVEGRAATVAIAPSSAAMTSQ